MKVLLTAFEPFDGRAKNASAEALTALIREREALPGLVLEARLLPVQTERAAEELCRVLEAVRPTALVSLGEARRDAICLEQQAINQRHFTRPDNAGNLIEDQPVNPDGPPVYPATLPLERMLSAIQAVGVPVRLSDDAGRYLCNEVFYTARHYAEQHGAPEQVGFIHVPHLPSAATDEDYPTLPASEVVRSLRAALSVLTP